MTKPTLTNQRPRRGPVRTRPEPLALEKRVMFDGAGVADLAAAALDRATLASLAQVDAVRETPAAPPVVMPPIGADRQELVFIVDNVGDAEALRAAVPVGAEVHLLDGHGDALAQMARLLAGRQNLDAIHLISHGAEGRLELGTTALDTASLADRQAALAGVGASLAPGGDLLLYGCSVAADRTLVEALARITQADVAASTDATGASALGGNWTLEATVGSLETNTLAFPAYSQLLAPPPAGLYTFANASAAGDGTLTTADGFFSLSRLDGNGGGHILRADGYGAYIDDGTTVGSATTSYIQVAVKSGGSFQVTDAVIGDYDYNYGTSPANNDFYNVYAVGYAGGNQVAITSTGSSVGAYLTDLNLNFSRFSGVAIDAFRVYAAPALGRHPRVPGPVSGGRR